MAATPTSRATSIYPHQYQQHDPGHRYHRQRQPGADQSHVIDATPEGGTTTLTLNGSGGVTNTATAGGHRRRIVGHLNHCQQHRRASGLRLDQRRAIDGRLSRRPLPQFTGGSLVRSAAAHWIRAAPHARPHDQQPEAPIRPAIMHNGSAWAHCEPGPAQLNGGNGAERLSGYRQQHGHAHRQRNRALDTIANNGGNAYIQGNGDTLTNTNNTIKGTGVIGNGSLALINSDVIDAMAEGGTATLTLNGLVALPIPICWRHRPAAHWRS